MTSGSEITVNYSTNFWKTRSFAIHVVHDLKHLFTAFTGYDALRGASTKRSCTVLGQKRSGN